MKCIDILMDEHKVVLNLMQKLENHLSGENYSLDQIEANLNFFIYYVDGFHHAKEEDVLFKWMIQNNPGLEFGPIAVMAHEHDLGRAMVKRANELVQKLKQNFDQKEFNDLRDCLCMFFSMLRQHISKEDNVLYMMANNIDQHFKNGDEFMLPRFNSVKLSDANKVMAEKLLMGEL